jgi:hypothetical protein
MNATEWAELLEARARPEAVERLYPNECRQVAALLRAMVAEREALENVVDRGDPDYRDVWMDSRNDRRRAEGE